MTMVRGWTSGIKLSTTQTACGAYLNEFHDLLEHCVHIVIDVTELVHGLNQLLDSVRLRTQRRTPIYYILPYDTTKLLLTLLLELLNVTLVLELRNTSENSGSAKY